MAFTLFRGDAFNEALGWIHPSLGRPDRVLRRALLLFVLTWGLLLLLAALQGVAWGPTPRERFLLDFAAIGQFFIAIPAFLIGEPLIDRQMGWALGTFQRSGLVRDDDELGRIAVAATRAARWRLVDFGLLAFVYVNTWAWAAEELTNGSGSWHATMTRGHEVVTLAGFWVWSFAVPCWFFLCARLAWKIVIWSWVLWRISRMSLHLVPSHPDAAGGIGFLGDVQATFGIVIFAVGVAIACTVGYKVTVEHAPWGTFATDGPWMGYVAIAPLAFLSPLLLFTRQMYAAKHGAILEYSPAAAHYGRRFEQTWITSHRYRDDEFAVVNDVQAYTNVASVYGAIESMRVVPFDLVTLGRLLLAAAGPMLPLLIGRFPLLSLLSRLLGGGGE
jgi:hypothetical protein